MVTLAENAKRSLSQRLSFPADQQPALDHEQKRIVCNIDCLLKVLSRRQRHIHVGGMDIAVVYRSRPISHAQWCRRCAPPPVCPLPGTPGKLARTSLPKLAN